MLPSKGCTTIVRNTKAVKAFKKLAPLAVFETSKQSVLAGAPRSVIVSDGIPSEISSIDTNSINLVPADPFEIYNNLIPNTEVVQLEGALNLGGLLWAVVLYCGISTGKQRPAEWLLPLIAKALSREHEQWFIDALEGFQYRCPPEVELFR